ncbi:MAG: class E sortase [Candidatus Saccharibacteria bacterium]|nr:class E sortase [Candidatus Saccharibacteria bacterium]
MDNKNGGQSSTPPSWNAWGQAAAQKAANGQVAQKPKSTEPTAAQKQQQTAANIARQKVLEAYKHQPQNYREPTKEAPAPQIKTEDWRKYHSAWQDYYQKYYGEYYGRAAKEYVARERLKIERDIAERESKAAEERAAIVSNATATPAPQAPSVKETTATQNDFKARIQKKVAKRAKKMRKSRHFIPLAIGFSILILGLLFQYNQVIIANAVAYMSPGGTEVNDITAIDPTVSANIHEKPTLMIPKLNVEVPIVFGSKNDLNSMANAMGNGVAHFSIRGASAKPGEVGNFAISGHSAGNIYQQSDYKFIFSGLTRMGSGDLIYVDYNGQRYTYRVTGTRTVDPSNSASLREIAKNNPGKPMITLITCTPLGTSKYRLLVYGEQIHPSYEGASEEETPIEESGDDNQDMPRNDDPPLTQFWKWLTGQE